MSAPTEYLPLRGPSVLTSDVSRPHVLLMLVRLSYSRLCGTCFNNPVSGWLGALHRMGQHPRRRPVGAHGRHGERIPLQCGPCAQRDYAYGPRSVVSESKRGKPRSGLPNVEGLAVSVTGICRANDRGSNELSNGIRRRPPSAVCTPGSPCPAILTLLVSYEGPPR